MEINSKHKIANDLKPLAYPVDKLQHLDGNPRIGNVEAVAKSYDKFGQRKPIVATKDGTVISGNHQLAAAKQLGWEKIAVLFTDDDELTAKAFALADNRTSDLGTYDDDFLADMLGSVASDLELLKATSFDEKDLLALVKKQEVIEDEAPEIRATEIKLGQKYQLGNHTLVCGDTTNNDYLNLLISDNVIDLVFTDPPYGMKKEKDGVLNDNLNYEHLLEFNKKWIPLTFDVLKENGSWYCWGIDEPLMDIYVNILKPMIKENKITFRNLITWNKFNNQKPTAIEQQKSYVVYDEKCLFVMSGVQGFNNNADNYYKGFDSIVTYLKLEKNKANLSIKDCKKIAGHSIKSGCHWFDKSQWSMPTEEVYNSWKNYCIKNNITAFKKDYEEIKKDYEEIKKEWYKTRAYFNNTHQTYMTAVFNFPPVNKEEKQEIGNHATPKPIKLCTTTIKSSSRINENVLDVFGGSGSTLIACEQLERNCFIMELDPIYCQVIIDRWQNLTGQKAELIESI